MDEKKKLNIPGGDRSVDLYVPITLEDAHERLLSLNGHMLEFGGSVPLDLKTDAVDDDTLHFEIRSQGSEGVPLIRGFIKRWEQDTIRLRAWGFIPREMYWFGLFAAGFTVVFFVAKLLIDPTPSVEPFNIPEPFAVLLMIALMLIAAGVLIFGWKFRRYMTSGERAALDLLQRAMSEPDLAVDGTREHEVDIAQAAVSGKHKNTIL